MAFKSQSFSSKFSDHVTLYGFYPSHVTAHARAGFVSHVVTVTSRLGARIGYDV